MASATVHDGKDSDIPTINTLILALYPHCHPPSSKHNFHMPMPIQAAAQPGDFVDALATLCALQDNCESVSVALSTSPEGLELYLSTASLPPALPPQMDHWLKQLRNVGREDLSASNPTIESESELTECQRDMIISLYRPSYAKFRTRLRDGDDHIPSKLLGRVEVLQANETDLMPYQKDLQELLLSLRSFTAIVRDDDHCLTDDDCLVLHHAGARFSSMLTNKDFLEWLHAKIAVYAEDMLHACALLYIIGSTLISAALAKKTRPALHNYPIVYWIVPTRSQTFFADMHPENLARRWAEYPNISRDHALRALESATKLPPGLVRQETTYVDDHATVHCEVALLAYLVQNEIPAFPHIACSRDPCLCCLTYGEAMKRTLGTDITFRRSIWTPRLQIPWVMPEQTSQGVTDMFRTLVAMTLSDKVWEYGTHFRVCSHCY